MTPAEINLNEIAKRYLLVSAQVSQAYSTEQAKLNLDLVLTPTRLSTAAGAQESLAAIAHLASVTAKHKTAVEKIFLACANDFTQALAEVPENKQAEYRLGILKSLHALLAAQNQFYANREKWIEAANEVCTLVDARRGSSSFEGEYISFAEDSDLSHFEKLMEVIEDVHRAELEHARQMPEYFAESAKFLGFNPK
jgi:hypothetical protein